jgi:hypothetical protein
MLACVHAQTPQCHDRRGGAHPEWRRCWSSRMVNRRREREVADSPGVRLPLTDPCTSTNPSSGSGAWATEKKKLPCRIFPARRLRWLGGRRPRAALPDGSGPQLTRSARLSRWRGTARYQRIVRHLRIRIPVTYSRGPALCSTTTCAFRTAALGTMVHGHGPWPRGVRSLGAAQCGDRGVIRGRDCSPPASVQRQTNGVACTIRLDTTLRRRDDRETIHKPGSRAIRSLRARQLCAGAGAHRFGLPKYPRQFLRMPRLL